MRSKFQLGKPRFNANTQRFAEVALKAFFAQLCVLCVFAFQLTASAAVPADYLSELRLGWSEYQKSNFTNSLTHYRAAVAAQREQIDFKTRAVELTEHGQRYKRFGPCGKIGR